MHHLCQLPDPYEFLAYSNLTLQGMSEVSLVDEVEKDLLTLLEWAVEFSKRPPEGRSWPDTQEMRWKLVSQLERLMPLYTQLKAAGPEYHLPVELSLRDFRLVSHHIVDTMHRHYDAVVPRIPLIQHRIESWNMDLVYLTSRLHGTPIPRTPTAK